MEYKHTEIGYLYIFFYLAFLGGLIIGISVYYNESNFYYFLSLFFSFYIFLQLLFSIITIEINEKTLKIIFKPVYLKRVINLEDIKEVNIVDLKNNNYLFNCGRPINFNKDYVVYQVSGNKGVEIVLKDNKKIKIATKKPEELYRKLKIYVNS